MTAQAFEFADRAVKLLMKQQADIADRLANAIERKKKVCPHDRIFMSSAYDGPCEYVCTKCGAREERGGALERLYYEQHAHLGDAPNPKGGAAFTIYEAGKRPCVCRVGEITVRTTEDGFHVVESR